MLEGILKQSVFTPKHHLGHWQPNTASVDWCETNYEVSYYIAEFFNTISSLAMVVVGLLGVFLHPWAEKRFKFAFISVALVGAGSVLFHATLGKLGQVLDEVPMLYSALIFSYIFITQNHSLSKANQRYLAYGMGALSGVTTSLVIWTNGLAQFLLFHLSFNSSHSYALYQMYKIWRNTSATPSRSRSASETTPEAKKHREHSRRELLTIFYIGVVIYACAFICWLLDFFGCPFFNPQSPSALLPWNPQFHAWWHVLVSVGLYMMVLLVLVRQVEMRGGETELKFAFRVLPYLELTHPFGSYTRSRSVSAARSRQASPVPGMATRTRSHSGLRTRNSLMAL